MTKDPKTCKNSHLFGDVYICQLECVPCAALNNCALETIDKLTSSIKELIDAMPDFRKESKHGR